MKLLLTERKVKANNTASQAVSYCESISEGITVGTGPAVSTAH